jgi:hypothetical protein
MRDVRSFRPVWLKDGQCPNEEWHFRGAAREVYSYLKLLAQNHGGFVFPSVRDIAENTKNWTRDKEPFSIGQCKRILRIFRELGILGKFETRLIHGRTYRGWQFGRHAFWAKSHGGICDFIHWESYESKHRKCMGHNCKSNQQNVPDCDTDCDTACDPKAGDCDTDCDTAASVALTSKFESGIEIQRAAGG